VTPGARVGPYGLLGREVSLEPGFRYALGLPGQGVRLLEAPTLER
jgi:hypothetical protein